MSETCRIGNQGAAGLGHRDKNFKKVKFDNGYQAVTFDTNIQPWKLQLYTSRVLSFQKIKRANYHQV